MDEGVDPTDMCQSLVHKVGQSKQLMAIADPGIIVLFDAWLDELEEEVLAYMKKKSPGDPVELAESLGLSRSGAAFMIAKLKREKKIP